MGKVATEATLREGVELLRAIVNGHTFENWRKILGVVRQGHAQDYFNIGDQIEVAWTKDGTTYQLPFDVVSFDNVLKEGETDPSPGMWLQSHYAMDELQYDASEAIYVTDVALPAGTYNFTIGTTWGKCVAGKVYQFTTTQTIPAGGQIMVGMNDNWFFWAGRDLAPSDWRVHTFASNAATTPLDSNLELSEGSEGTALGSISRDTKYSQSGVNNLCRACNGYDRWSMSAMRQYLNSTEAKGAWWAPKNPFDRAPKHLNTLDGFMSGFDKEFLSIIGKVKVTTALNNVSDIDIGASEDTYDKFFLASLEQEYIVPEAAAGVEGAYWPYWKDRLGLNSPQAQKTAGANANHIRYSYNEKSSVAMTRLRSVNMELPSSTWIIYPDGAVWAYMAAQQRLVCPCPACVIC